MTQPPASIPPAISCALPPSKDLPDHARRAEELGYERLWVYDSPALYGDIWMAIGRVVDATDHIGLAAGVAIPSLRHVMVTASAIAAVEEIAPGRLVAGIRNRVHGPGFGPPRPIDVPLLLAPIGPKGFSVSQDLADGVILAGELPFDPPERWGIRAMLASGTVLADGEDHTTERVRAAAGPMATTGYHAMWEWSRPSLADAPGGPEWLARLEADRPPAEQHLSVHEGHLVAVTERDEPLLDVMGPEILATGWTGDAASIAARLDALAGSGITEVVYQPAGPDIAGELEAFAKAKSAG